MILLDNEKLRDVFERIYVDPNDSKATEELLTLLKPVLKLTIDKFHGNIDDDLQQEILLAVLKKKDWLAKAFLTKEMRNPTNYIFGMFKNAALATVQKEKKQAERMVSIEDIKVDAIITQAEITSSRAIQRLRAEVIEWLESRFPQKSDFNRAVKYVDMILSGKRPSFKTVNIKKVYGGRQDVAKECYSIVLQQVRERIKANASDFGLRTDD